MGEPTISDAWPDPSEMPDEVKEAFQGMWDVSEKLIAEIKANPKHSSKS